jgi:hypothetical protein
VVLWMETLEGRVVEKDAKMSGRPEMVMQVSFVTAVTEIDGVVTSYKSNRRKISKTGN